MILGLDQPKDKSEDIGNKRFWSYINSLRAEKGGVASLKNEAQLTKDSLGKATVLNDVLQDQMVYQPVH